MHVDGPTIGYNIETDTFDTDVSVQYLVRYLKGIYTNKERFINNFLNYYRTAVTMYNRADRLANLELLATYYDIVTPYSYQEAFNIEDDTFRARVFGSINVREMMESLGHTLIKVEGKPVTHRLYKEDGSYTMIDYDVIYELHSVDTTDLGAEGTAYAVKCWCTSTNKEHWLWVDEEYAKKGPLEAIASTVRVYKNMLPYIKCIKRQGDVMLFEMEKEVLPEGETVPLTADQYFGWLVAQT